MDLAMRNGDIELVYELKKSVIHSFISLIGMLAVIRNQESSIKTGGG
jgi:hypothetical protein